MARTRFTVGYLKEVLDAGRLPLFVLDDARRVVFWSQPCAEWTGVAEQAMLGQRCDYHAPDGPPPEVPLAAAASGQAPAARLALELAPPAEVFWGCRRRTLRTCSLTAGGTSTRWIEYVPLAEGSDAASAVLALVEPVEAEAAATVFPPASAVPDARVDERAEPSADDLHRQLSDFRRQFSRRFVADRFVGRHPAIVRARQQAALAARGGANVWIAGPVGSGKEHLARSIHSARTPDGGGSLLPLSCASLGGELLWSTATAWLSNEPAIQSGRPATLLLSDVDQLAAEVQPALAELLAAGRTNLQAIGTSALSSEAAVAAGAVRPDLAALLGTVEIRLPALAERLDDLPLLAQALLEEANARGGKQVAGFTPEALDLLAGYPWPGNCDELAAMIAEAHAAAGGPEIGPRDLPKRIHLAADAAQAAPRAIEAIQLEEFLARVERELIERALKRAKGNKSRAAKLLGLTRPRLYRRMVVLGLAAEE